MQKYFLYGIIILIIVSMTSCKPLSEDKSQNNQSQFCNQPNSFDAEGESKMTNESQNSSTLPLTIDINQSQLDLILERINNNSPYNELITKEIDIDLFIKKCDEDPTIPLFTKLTLITDVDTEFGIECLRKTENNSLYSVHKVKQGGLLYVFYRYHSGTGKYIEIKNWYYVKNKLKYKDFSSVINGTDINKVSNIDSITDVYNERANKYDKSVGIATYHYLEDGILLLFYKYKNGKFQVVGQDYQKDFQVELFSQEAKVEQYNGRILEIDFLK